LTISITRYGIIKGGVCDTEHENRASREAGANMMLERFIDFGGFKKRKNDGKYQAAKEVYYDSIEMYKYWPNAQREVGGASVCTRYFP